MPRPKRREPPTIDLELAGIVNGVPFHATGTARVVRPDAPLQVEFASTIEVLHWDPLLAALTCCEAVGLAAGADARVVAQDGEWAVESRAVVHDDQGRTIGDVATSAVVDAPDGAVRARIVIRAADVRLEATERLARVTRFEAATQQLASRLVRTTAWTAESSRGNVYRGVVVTAPTV